MDPGRRGDGDGRARGGVGGAPGEVQGGVVPEQRNPRRRDVHFALENDGWNWVVSGGGCTITGSEE